ncbi:CoA-binding protein [Primorskyibacter flagellatus]|uniref:CoA-binding protein n=1 Tax=Primorskyibacter flagellatus TaxID=1387277 RepID=A0A917AGR8_9RHOB|nr:acetate--CoA ligase family protein [Primorskyibacter flagellatus]GGE50326.1 CoA-binding protein [Primorskyibacter flagellatus]
MPKDNYEPYVFPDLTRLFAPRTVAVIGASEKEHSIGNHAMRNIVQHSAFAGTVYPVNPKQAEVMGLRCYPDVASLPEAVDVIVVVVPAPAVRAAVEQAGEKGCGFAVILTSGFSEADDWGRAEEAALVEISQRTGIRIYGPNCPGLVNLNLPLGLTFSPAFKDDITPGPIGLATQGGGLGRNMIQHNVRGIGFGLWSSSGNECDLQVADFVHHMAQDPEIKVIGCLIEGFKDGARFAAACQEAARKGKPVVGLKVGRSAYGARAAQSHTASITGSAEVNSTVFRQMGVVEVDDLDELVDVAMLFTRKMPEGTEKIAVFASSGGAASLCADNVGIAGLELAEFTPETAKRLADALPPYAGMSNPIDTTSISISHPDAYREALAACADDANVGLVLAPLPMDYGTYSVVNAGSLKAVQDAASVPIVPIWMSERQGGGYAKLAEAGLPPFRSLRNMRKAVRRWIDYGLWRAARDTGWQPGIIATGSQGDPDPTRTLSEVEGKRALAAAGVPATAPEIATTAEDAVRIAQAMGTVAMKIVSAQITHKSDIGGVKLGVTGDGAAAAFAEIMANARAAVPSATLDGVLIEPMAPAGGLEAFVGILRDPVFGQVMTFGLGGIYVEMFADVTRRMLPVTRPMAEEMIGELKSAKLLTGYRGQPKRDVAALADLIVKVSDYAMATPGLVEMDINPVWTGTEGQGVMALDAVIVVEE